LPVELAVANVLCRPRCSWKPQFSTFLSCFVFPQSPNGTRLAVHPRSKVSEGKAESSPRKPTRLGGAGFSDAGRFPEMVPSSRGEKPGGTSIGESIRDLLAKFCSAITQKHGPPETELAFCFEASRQPSFVARGPSSPRFERGTCVIAVSGFF